MKRQSLKLRDKYFSRATPSLKNIIETYPSPNRMGKNRSFLTCKVKPEAQKTTRHVETRGKTRDNTQTTVFVSLCQAARALLLSGKVCKVNVIAFNFPLFCNYIVFLECIPCALLCLMGTLNPLWMQGFRVNWYGVNEQQRMPLGAFVLISVFFRVCCHGIDTTCHLPIANYCDSHISHAQYKKKKSIKPKILQANEILAHNFILCTPKWNTYSIIQPFNFLMRSQSKPLLFPVIFEWTVIYFTVPFGWSSTSLWSTFQHLHSTVLSLGMKKTFFFFLWA